MQDTDPDVELMLALRGGDESAFDALFARWSAPLARFLERMVGDAATAEELVQEAFLRLYRARERYAPEARFSTWLYRIASNLALNELRRPRRRNPHASTDAEWGEETHVGIELSDDGPRVDDWVDARQRQAAVEQRLAALPERQRMALWLSTVEGLSYAEVAEALDTTTGSVKSLVHRARAALVDGSAANVEQKERRSEGARNEESGGEPGTKDAATKKEKEREERGS